MLMCRCVNGCVIVDDCGMLEVHRYLTSHKFPFSSKNTMNSNEGGYNPFLQQIKELLNSQRTRTTFLYNVNQFKNL